MGERGVGGLDWENDGAKNKVTKSCMGKCPQNLEVKNGVGKGRGGGGEGVRQSKVIIIIIRISLIAGLYQKFTSGRFCEYVHWMKSLQTDTLFDLFLQALLQVFQQAQLSTILP